MTARQLTAFLEAAPRAAIISVAGAKGSTPREQGAWMLVSPSAIFGTIGGGQLEFMAIAKARELIAQNIATGALDIPLGPEIGQCCGGRVSLDIAVVDAMRRAEIVEAAKREDDTRPHVYLFGGGHVGHALSAALSLLPVRALLVETRAEAIEGIAPGVETRLTAVPEEMVRTAPPGSAFLVLTHDHALDFLIVQAALCRDDAAYVGMIGSKTKKATFRNWYLEHGGDEGRFARLVIPIGGTTVTDKRPSVIAVLTAAEVMAALSK